MEQTTQLLETARVANLELTLAIDRRDAKIYRQQVSSAESWPAGLLFILWRQFPLRPANPFHSPIPFDPIHAIAPVRTWPIDEVPEPSQNNHPPPIPPLVRRLGIGNTIGCMPRLQPRQQVLFCVHTRSFVFGVSPKSPFGVCQGIDMAGSVEANRWRSRRWRSRCMAARYGSTRSRSVWLGSSEGRSSSSMRREGWSVSSACRCRPT